MGYLLETERVCVCVKWADFNYFLGLVTESVMYFTVCVIVGVFPSGSGC